MANLNELMASIAEAIRHKRNITDKINAQDFPNEIEKITGGGGSKNEPITITTNGVYTAPEGVGYSPINVSVKLEGNPLQYIIDNHGGNGKPSCRLLFNGYQGTSLDILSQCDFSKVTDMRYMFIGCSNLTTIPPLDTSQVTQIYAMFKGCSNLTTIPQLDTSKVTDMESMFNSCSNLTKIPPLDTSKVINMRGMFYACLKLTTIDITHMNIKKSEYTENFARACCSLTKLIIRNMDTIPQLYVNNPFYNCYHFTGTVNADYNPEGLKDGRIYVPDNKVETLKTAFMWKNYADIIVPLSLLDATEINDINVYEDEEGNIINIDNLSYEEVQ